MVPDPPVVPASARFLCVYREGIGQAGLDVRSFPYAYCHYLAYCCMSVLPSQGDRAALDTLSQLGTAMGGTPFSVSVIVGGSPVEDPYLLALLLDADSVQRLVEPVGTRQSKTGRERDVVVDAFLSRVSSLEEAAAAVQGGRSRDSQAYFGPSLSLTRCVSVWWWTATATWPRRFDFPRTPVMFCRINLGRLSKNYGDHVCHGLRTAAVTVNGSEAAIDISYGSTCSMNITNVYSRGQATVGVTAFGDTVSFLEPPNASKFAASLCKEAQTDCIAFWDPESDDYAGTCGGPSFPLIKAVVGMPV
ncbi:hypothetical protein MRX96_027232 [Rhipicephalus microplus]